MNEHWFLTVMQIVWLAIFVTVFVVCSIRAFRNQALPLLALMVGVMFGVMYLDFVRLFLSLGWL